MVEIIIGACFCAIFTGFAIFFNHEFKKTHDVNDRDSMWINIVFATCDAFNILINLMR